MPFYNVYRRVFEEHDGVKMATGPKHVVFSLSPSRERSFYLVQERQGVFLDDDHWALRADRDFSLSLGVVERRIYENFCAELFGVHFRNIVYNISLRDLTEFTDQVSCVDRTVRSLSVPYPSSTPLLVIIASSFLHHAMPDQVPVSCHTPITIPKPLSHGEFPKLNHDYEDLLVGVGFTRRVRVRLSDPRDSLVKCPAFIVRPLLASSTRAPDVAISIRVIAIKYTPAREYYPDHFTVKFTK
uniref:Uncharacterized protein n=1 Tax=Timema cristinae TaxID=61476 RepID=A0A7R9C9E7_TIMCR|nr:unnamed protein product [Timema cristinae]